MSEYLNTAKRFYEEALKEWEEGKEKGDGIIIREAAEKAWNAMVQATNYLFEKKGLPIPKSHHERRRTLGELSKKDPKIEEKGLRDRYMARCETLHEDCFYDGICDPELLEKDFLKVQNYLKDVEVI